jgi:DNA-binding LacI/PurR family transcriptional regulator
LRVGKQPTAVICSNDWTAIGALHAVHAAGLRVPDDISVVGFDDIPLAQFTNPSLTTVRMTASDVGATAFNALFRLIGEEAVEGDVYQIPTKLVVRDSTGRPKRR